MNNAVKNSLVGILLFGLGVPLGYLIARPGRTPPPPAIVSKTSIPPTAAKTAESVPAGEVDAGPLKVLTNAGQINEALAALLKVKNFDERLKAINKLVASIDDAAIHDALELARMLPAGPLRDTFVRELLARWAVEDAEAALAFAKQLPVGSSRNEALVGVIKGLVQVNPTRALAISNEYDAIRLRQKMQREIFERWAATDPRTAIEAAANMK